MLLKKIKRIRNNPEYGTFIHILYEDKYEKIYGIEYDYSNINNETDIKIRYRLNSKWHGKIIYILHNIIILRYYINNLSQGLAYRPNDKKWNYNLNNIVKSKNFSSL